jgi:hypothetical protein
VRPAKEDNRHNAPQESSASGPIIGRHVGSVRKARVAERVPITTATNAIPASTR